jgi:hypothetical protein
MQPGISAWDGDQLKAESGAALVRIILAQRTGQTGEDAEGRWLRLSLMQPSRADTRTTASLAPPPV